MRVLITGIQGFTGRYVKRELESHGFTTVELTSNLIHPDSLVEEISKILPDAVIHLAGIAYVAHSTINAFYDVNLIGTRNLLEALSVCSARVSSVLLASSSNIYGNQLSQTLNEDTPPNPQNDYAVSKLAMEHLARNWFDKLPICITRPFNYTGVGQKKQFLVPKIIDHFLRKMNIIELGNIDIRREFNDVRDVARAYRKILELSPAGETVNICTGLTYSIKDIIISCEKITSQNIEVEVNKEYQRDNELRTLAGDGSKLKSMIGEWCDHNLDSTIEWMLRERPIQPRSATYSESYCA